MNDFELILFRESKAYIATSEVIFLSERLKWGIFLTIYKHEYESIGAISQLI